MAEKEMAGLKRWAVLAKVGFVLSAVFLAVALLVGVFFGMLVYWYLLGGGVVIYALIPLWARLRVWCNLGFQRVSKTDMSVTRKESPSEQIPMSAPLKPYMLEKQMSDEEYAEALLKSLGGEKQK